VWRGPTVDGRQENDCSVDGKKENSTLLSKLRKLYVPRVYHKRKFNSISVLFGLEFEVAHTDSVPDTLSELRSFRDSCTPQSR
jgi:hypothetical protein